MLDRARGQDACAPGGVIGIERAGKVNAAPGGGALAGDHAITDDRERMRGGLAAGWLGDVGRFSGRFSGFGNRGRHSLHFSISFFRSSISIPGMNERLTIQGPHSLILGWLPFGRCDTVYGSGPVMVQVMANRLGVMMAARGNIWAIRTWRPTGPFRQSGAD
jgi:hypothetical protein